MATTQALETDAASVREEIGKDRLINMYKRMVLIREFEQACAKAFQAKKSLVSCTCILAKKP